MDFNFNNHIVSKFDIGGNTFYFTESMRNSVIASTILIVLALIVRRALKNFSETPTGFQNAIEILVETFSQLVDSTIGKKYSFFGNWYFSVFLYILTCNYIGVIGLRVPTANLAVTFSLAVVTFILIHTAGICFNTKEYFKSYLIPFAVFLPVNIIGSLAVPVSLAFRLFGNLLGGTIIMTMLYAALPPIFRAVIPVPFHFYFDIFAGLLQAVIFTLLGLMFVGGQLSEEN